MTLVTFDVRAVSAAGRVPVDGRIRWQPAERRVDGGVVILPEVHSVALVGGVASAELDPGYYLFTEVTAAGTTALRLVPATGPVAYASLGEVDPVSLAVGSPDPAWEAMAKATVTTGTVTGDDLVLTRTDGTSVVAGNVRGPIGTPNSLSVGTVTTGTPGSSVTASITGAAPVQTLNLGIPQGATGAKGDPGGIVDGTVLGNVSLDTITTTGTYVTNDPAFITTANKYPVASRTGHLLVLRGVNASWLTQEYRLVESGTSPNVFYRRNNVGGTWTVWRAFAYSRVDQTAGRAIYQWDDLNNREQIIYGDTGWRNITSLSTVSPTGSLFMRRTGAMVELNFANFAFTGVNGSNVVAVLPTGFRPLVDVNAVSATDTTKRLHVASSGNVSALTHATTAAPYGAHMTFSTTDAWPATLPGAASGTIPNL